MYEYENWNQNMTDETKPETTATESTGVNPSSQETQILHITEVAQQTAQSGQQPVQNEQPVQSGQQPVQNEQPVQSEQQPLQNEQPVQSEQQPLQNEQQPGVTYSWVNPKVQQNTTQQNTQQTWSEQARAALQQPNTRAARSAKQHKKAPKRTWGSVIAMALVFGLIAGGVMFGVNYAGGALLGKNEKVTATTAESYRPVESTLTTAPSEKESDAAEASAAGAGTVAEVTENAMPSLVTISTMSVAEMESFFGGTQEYEVEGAGTGVIVGQNETELLIATNNHVIEGASEVSVGFIDETASPAQIKGTDPDVDLAVIAVKLSDIPEETMNAIRVIAIGNSDDLVLGEQVVAIGNALGYGQSVTSGYVSAFDRELNLTDGYEMFTSSGLIQTDAAINSGNSGGALLNMRGELVGINEAKSSMSSTGATVDNVGYSIPISKALPILEDLMSLETKERVAEEERGYLGIRCADVNSETSERYNIPTGVYVREVNPGGPADEAGLLQGDVITRMDGKKISSYDALIEAMDYCRAGDEVEMVIQRAENGEYKEKTVRVTLGEESALEGFQSEEQIMPNEMQQPGN